MLHDIKDCPILVCVNVDQTQIQCVNGAAGALSQRLTLIQTRLFQLRMHISLAALMEYPSGCPGLRVGDVERGVAFCLEMHTFW